MAISTTSSSNDGISLRQAALVAGFAYLLNPVSYAEFSIYPRLVIPENIAQTAHNISTHSDQFLVAILCYFTSAIGDVVIAWALYYLLRPVSRSLSLLMAWFQLVYAGIFIVSLLSLVSAWQLLTVPGYLTAFGSGPLHAQLMLQLHVFRYDWSISLIVFGIHLVLLGYLIFRSSYVPRILGALLVINGLGWMINGMGPYAFPATDFFGYLQFTFLGELCFMLWLLIRGWRIKEVAEG